MKPRITIWHREAKRLEPVPPLADAFDWYLAVWRDSERAVHIERATSLEKFRYFASTRWEFRKPKNIDYWFPTNAPIASCGWCLIGLIFFDCQLRFASRFIAVNFCKQFGANENHIRIIH